MTTPLVSAIIPAYNAAAYQPVACSDWTQEAEGRQLNSGTKGMQSGVKRYVAVSAIYRNRVTGFDDHLMLTATELWNFYLMAA